MGKKIGDMTPAEKQEAVRRAAGRFQAELTANADAIGKVLEQPLEGEPLIPSVATSQTIAALGDLAPKFRVESRWNPHACQPLREATVRTTVTVSAPLTSTEDAVTALRTLPGIVQLSADRRSVIVFRA